MTLTTTAPDSVGFATVEHPHFVGMAHLRSLLSHEEVAQDGERMDAVLDMISCLMQNDSARGVVKAFCKVRQSCEPACYLAVFRLRRWLEEQVVVRVNHGAWQPLDLAFQDYRRVVQQYRRKAWEWQGEEGPAAHEMELRFGWKQEATALALSPEPVLA